MKKAADDPRITAVALGEADERTADKVQAWAAASPEAGAALDDARWLAQNLSSGLGAVAARWSSGLTDAQRASVRAYRPRQRRLPFFRLPTMELRRRPLAALGATVVALSLLCLASPAGTAFITGIYAWQEQVKSSTGHQSAARTAYDGPQVTIWDLLKGGPSSNAVGGGGSDYDEIGAYERDLGDREALAQSGPAATTAPKAPITGGPDLQPVAGGEAALPGVVPMVVKEGMLTLEVPNVKVAVDRAGAIAAQQGGFVVRSDAYHYEGPEEAGEDYTYASIVLRVPADRFEAAASSLRALASRVLTESSSGEEVTAEYVDMQSQLANLEATRARVRSFLDQAQTVAEALAVNAELSQLEGQISVIKGRMAQLGDQAAYSTLTVEFQPQPSETEEPAPAAAAWQPGKTARRALAALEVIAKALVDAGIWLLIVVVPIALPFWIVAWAVHRRRNRLG